VNNAVRVAEVDELWNRSELELARELAEGQHNLQSGQKSMKVEYTVVDIIAIFFSLCRVD
jgi:hypothetical protein